MLLLFKGSSKRTQPEADKKESRFSSRHIEVADLFCEIEVGRCEEKVVIGAGWGWPTVGRTLGIGCPRLKQFWNFSDQNGRHPFSAPNGTICFSNLLKIPEIFMLEFLSLPKSCGWIVKRLKLTSFMKKRKRYRELRTSEWLGRSRQGFSYKFASQHQKNCHGTKNCSRCCLKTFRFLHLCSAHEDCEVFSKHFAENHLFLPVATKIIATRLFKNEIKQTSLYEKLNGSGVYVQRIRRKGETEPSHICRIANSVSQSGKRYQIWRKQIKKNLLFWSSLPVLWSRDNNCCAKLERSKTCSFKNQFHWTFAVQLWSKDVF